ncbi:MAG: M20/M25/M40 family metallo-hydrolase [Acidobacteriota bacterium]
MLDVIDLTRKLVDIPSVTGAEGKVGEYLHDLLENQGWQCHRQEVSPDRFNLVATTGRASVILTTHLDTVPPFFPSSEDEIFVHGRGSCDAKGIAASMICAAEALRQDGMADLGLLFVVGEETDSIGAIKACELDLDCSFIIDGEPTDNELVVGHKGIVAVQLSAMGTAAHSAYPDQGDSAIDKLIDVLGDLKDMTLPNDLILGDSYLNIGTIEGGRAANVVADSARAQILIRSVVDSARYVKALEQVVADRCQLEILKLSEPQTMETVESFSTKVVGFGTDIPALRSLGRPLLFGPGSIEDAHTADEKISKKQLLDSVNLYQQLVRVLQGRVHND